jgi:diguanylate cyclase (GGDEF)-like protein
MGVSKMITFIGSLIEKSPFIHPELNGAEIDRMFKENKDLEGIVVAENNIPIGLVSRSQFYQKLGTLYGFNVYMGRPVKLIMNVEPLIVDFFMPLPEVSTLAMKRRKEELYDYVIITKNKEFQGIVTIKNLLIQLAEVQSNIAKSLNPLTGLPGNQLIDQKLASMSIEQPFSLLYIDLDFFKAYNDTYGFYEGDRLIQETASIIKAGLGSNSFVGHVGGDDFISIFDHFEYQGFCEALIVNFNSALRSFYKDEDWQRGFVHVENRNGIKENIPLVSLSIAVVTNERQAFSSISEMIDAATLLKKKCKQINHSCYLSNSMIT